MKLNKLHRITFRQLLFSPYLLALVVSLPFIVFFLIGIEKYSTETTRHFFTDKTDEIDFWADVNGDGNYERIQTFKNKVGNAGVIIKNKNENALGQWNLKADSMKCMGNGISLSAI